MPSLTAVLHTYNDGLRLGRALETLCPCDDILIVDHGSDDDTQRVARQYGATVILAANGSGKWPDFGKNAEWLLCLDPRESLTEGLSATLFEWKSSAAPAGLCFSFLQREETPRGWVQHARPQTRLVPAQWDRWDGHFPIAESPVLIDGELLRFAFP